MLATAWDDHALYQGKANQPIPGPGMNQPMLWTVQYGQGRVFANVLGHDAPAMKMPAFVTTLVPRRGVGRDGQRDAADPGRDAAAVKQRSGNGGRVWERLS